MDAGHFVLYSSGTVLVGLGVLALIEVLRAPELSWVDQGFFVVLLVVIFPLGIAVWEILRANLWQRILGASAAAGFVIASLYIVRA